MITGEARVPGTCTCPGLIDQSLTDHPLGLKPAGTAGRPLYWRRQ
jgi:hypothetical protein